MITVMLGISRSTDNKLSSHGPEFLTKAQQEGKVHE